MSLKDFRVPSLAAASAISLLAIGTRYGPDLPGLSYIAPLPVMVFPPEPSSDTFNVKLEGKDYLVLVQHNSFFTDSAKRTCEPVSVFGDKIGAFQSKPLYETKNCDPNVDGYSFSIGQNAYTLSIRTNGKAVTSGDLCTETVVYKVGPDAPDGGPPVYKSGMACG